MSQSHEGHSGSIVDIVNIGRHCFLHATSREHMSSLECPHGSTAGK